MRSAATVALEFDSAKLFYFPTPRIIPENPDVTNGFDMSPYTPPCSGTTELVRVASWQVQVQCLGKILSAFSGEE